MDKKYYPIEIEEKWAKIWSERSINNTNATESFAQVIPPPNVTGTFHMGHSFQYAIMDFYSRYNHMSGKDSYWQVGADHAGIATQMVVENNLARKIFQERILEERSFLMRPGNGKNSLKKK